MKGFEHLQEQVKDSNDVALLETIKYLSTRYDLEQSFLKEDKSVDGMREFIRSKGQKHSQNGWNYIDNNVVFAWAVMYFSLPNSLLGIKDKTVSKNSKSKTSQTKKDKNNIISIDAAKEKVESKKANQLSLFGGVG